MDAELTAFVWTAELAEDAAGDGGTPIEVLRVGTWTDSQGRQVEITVEVLDALVVGFEEGAAGQDVPIDIDHQRKEAAGWIESLWREGERLLAKPNWNKVGRELVGERVYRYVSGWIDMGRNVLKSASLVNFPAVKGLAPVELSEVGGPLEAGDIVQEEDGMDEVKLEELREQIRAEMRANMEAELAEQRERETELRAEIRTEVEAELQAQLERRAGLVAFAEEVCGDEGANLAAKRDEVVEFLEALPGELVEQARDLLKAKVVQFGEVGTSREGRGALKKLPSAYKPLIEMWLADGHELGAFFEANAEELGAAGEYDLSDFEGKGD